MLELGKIQNLEVVKQVSFGVYLASGEKKEDKVLLPLKQVPKDIGIGDEIEVFLYKDSEDRLIATTTQPKLVLGGLAVLKVVEVGEFGAFLEWGLEKDLLLPFKMQTKKVVEGEECLVALYIDKSERLCAMMNVYEYLRTDSPYKKEDRVKGRVYEASDTFGMFVAVDDQFSALISRQDCSGSIRIGDVIQARITKVHDDGKLDLSTREKAYIQMADDAKLILEVLDQYGGVLPFNDKASPQVIKKEFELSKSAFKRAVGRLYKEGLIAVTENNIHLIKR